MKILFSPSSLFKVSLDLIHLSKYCTSLGPCVVTVDIMV